MNVDFLLIGQGICGTLLSRSLLNEGKTVAVIDNNDHNTSSKVASGVINPITGKRLVKTWLIDDLLPFAQDTYNAMSSALQVPLVRQCNILDFHLTADIRDAYEDKSKQQPGYLHVVNTEAAWADYFRFNYGIGEISPCMLVDSKTMLRTWRRYLAENNALIEEKFSLEECLISNEGIVYNGITAHSIIFCDGAAAAENPYFQLLPWSKDKGEAIIASIPGLPSNNIYKQGINIVPWADGLFWIGATHDWKYTDLNITLSFRKQVEDHLNYWLKLPFEIVDHIVAQRPANMERKPFVGMHPLHPTIGIFNGMGSKGCSLAPYFAQQFAKHLAHSTDLMPDVDIKRFTRILSR